MNGYETEELRDRHVRALVKKLGQAQATGNKELEAAVRAQLKIFGHEAKPAAERAEKRPAARRKYERRTAQKED